MKDMMIDDRLFEAVGLLEMLAQPVRLRVMCQLAERPENVSTLAAGCGLSQPAMSHHLRKLRDAGLVSTTRQGQQIVYRISAPEAQAILEVLHRLYCADTA